jgi:hypothetical protein
MTTYKLTDDGVLREDGAQIPAAAENKDWREYLEWVEKGNSPDPKDETAPVETSINPSEQIILADGVDIALLTFRGTPGASVDYTVNGQAQSLTLDDSGMDTLELTCDTPNTTLLVHAGSAHAVVFAVEVPS